MCITRLVFVAIVASALKAGLAFGGALPMDVPGAAADAATARDPGVYTGAGDRGR